jgi:hypothetical protein
MNLRRIGALFIQHPRRRVPVDWPREAEEKSDQNGKLFERSEFFPFRFFLSIAGSGQSPGSPFFGYFIWRSKESNSPPGETGAQRAKRAKIQPSALSRNNHSIRAAGCFMRDIDNPSNQPPARFPQWLQSKADSPTTCADPSARDYGYALASRIDLL